MNEFGIFSKEVATSLDISTSNLRKWSLLLEESGYVFERNEKNQRIYYNRDVNALSQMKIFMEKNRNIEDAVKVVIKRVQDKKNADETLSVIRDSDSKITLEKIDLKEIMQMAIKTALVEQKNEFTSLFKEYQQMAAVAQEEEKLPDPNNNWVARMKLEHKFREEARKLWDKKPEEERYIRSGLFRKIEDQSKRSDFIQDYINQKMIEAFSETE